MSSIFLDTDIILDVFAYREPFYHDSATVLTLIEERRIVGHTSALIFANLYYILRRLRSREVALASLRKLRMLITVLPVDIQGIDFALYSAFTDFEDAIQCYTAIHHQLGYLITRNIRDYQAADSARITICTPKEFLALWNVSDRK